MKIFRICGYGSGRSAFLETLVSHLRFDGVRVAIIKHAHKEFDLDSDNSDTRRQRNAGCPEVIIACRQRWAFLHENDTLDEPEIETFLPRLSPCDLVLAVGFDRCPIPGLEVYREIGRTPPLYLNDSSILAIVSEDVIADNAPRQFSPDDVEGIGVFIMDNAR